MAETRCRSDTAHTAYQRRQAEIYLNSLFLAGSGLYSHPKRKCTAYFVVLKLYVGAKTDKTHRFEVGFVVYIRFLIPKNLKNLLFKFF